MAKKQHIDSANMILGMVGKKANMYRNQGIAWALQFVKEKGIEELEKEVNRRNAIFIPLELSTDIVDDVLKQNVNRQFDEIQNLIIVEACLALHDRYRFGPKRLNEFAKMFNYHTGCTLDRDAIGEHYVKVCDHAEYLNEECGAHFDVEAIRRIEAMEDKERKE